MPNKTVSFLTRDEVRCIHQVLIERFGGPEGVRDLGLLDAGDCTFARLLPWLRQHLVRT